MRRRHYLIFATVLTALLASVFVFKRYLPYTGLPVMPKRPPTVVMTMENVRLVGLSHGSKLWSLRAGKVEVAQNRTSTILTGINQADVFSKNKVVFSVRAGKAIYDSLYRNLALSGGIIARSRGYKVTAEGAVWNPATAILCTTGPVVCRSDWGRLTAKRLELNVRSREISMWRVGWSIDVKNAQDQLDLGAVESAN